MVRGCCTHLRIVCLQATPTSWWVLWCVLSMLAVAQGKPLAWGGVLGLNVGVDFVLSCRLTKGRWSGLCGCRSCSADPWQRCQVCLHRLWQQS